MPTPQTIKQIIKQILNEINKLIKWKIKKLTKNRNVELREESKEFIHKAATAISNEKNVKEEPIISTFKNDMFNCNESIFGIIPPNPFQYWNNEYYYFYLWWRWNSLIWNGMWIISWRNIKNIFIFSYSIIVAK